MDIYRQLQDKNSRKFAVLVDPDKLAGDKAKALAEQCGDAKVDFIFVGGSLITRNNLEEVITGLKSNCDIPVVLFPGNYMQISGSADAILFLSLISGRNPEMLIGKHVIAAPYIKESGLEVIPTGYLLIDSGRQTTASYMSSTSPVPYEKDDVASVTAMAGEMLGLKMIYLDGGSGAENPVSGSMIKRVRDTVSVPLIVGGGIRTAEAAKQAWDAGADVVVVGNAIEKNLALIPQLAKAAGR